MELELRGITKRFGSLVANDHIDLRVAPGEIRGLLGENGAGKTTLMNVLYGLLQPDEGEIRVDGKPIVIHSPKDAINAHIGMVHQHFMLVPVFSVAENVILGLEPTRALDLLDRRQARRQVRELSERYGLQVNPDALVEDLPVGIQQRVEIIKALIRQASVLILDEPTAVLTPGETEDLFRVMRELRAGGRSIVFISHKLKEVQAIADQITVIRRGRVVGERPPTATDAELAALMVGRAVELRVSKEAAQPKDVVLDVSDLTVAGELVPDETGHSRNVVDDVSFQVRGGEILGIAGRAGQRADRAVRGADGAAARHRHGAAGRPGHQPGQPAGPAARRDLLHPGGPAAGRASSRTSRSRTTWCWTPTTGRRSPPASRWTCRRSGRTAKAWWPSSTCGPRRSTRRSARCRAATSRR